MGRFNRSLKNDLKNVLKNREQQFRFFGDSFQYKNRLRLNRPNSDSYIVGFYDRNEPRFNLKIKHEYRMILVPTNITIKSVSSIPLEDKIKPYIIINKDENILTNKSYKSQLLTIININNIDYTLMNVHINWMTSDCNLIQFFTEYSNVNNFIAIGDFNCSLKQFRNIWNEYNFRYLIPNKKTFIYPMGKNIDYKTDKIDQCLYTKC
jgi:hypothetical protein